MQLSLFPQSSFDAITNVASVPQRSPFRYPGGKTWLVPRLRQWLANCKSRPGLFIEPFAGGAISSLTVAAELLADHVIFVELDADVAAVWTTILDSEGAEFLIERIQNFQLTAENVSRILAQENGSVYEHAFQTIIRNRVNRGGILAPGAGVIKYGEAGKGIASRWYPETLAKRIMAICENRSRMTFIHGDGLQIIRDYVHDATACFFIDPPYTASSKKAGSRLYRHHDIDHPNLFEMMQTIRGDFLMTYDNAEEVQRLATKFQFETCTVAMKNTHHAKMNELLIGRQLNWVSR